ncbi:MAG TPA: energy transducer TonB [Gemmatimonadaceae bacterium]|nr:energy transducer TonB [Gemmatimonadaceae bacterium]
MLTRLLESKPQRTRSFWGTAVSTVGHTAVIAAAVFATAQARVEEPASREIVRWVRPPAASTPAVPEPPRHVERVAAMALPELAVLDRIDVKTVPLDLLGTPSVDPVTHGSVALPSPAPSGGDVRTDDGEPFVAGQVERQASLRSGSAAPVYPNVLRSAGVEGEVLVSFVVGANGRAEPATVRVMRSDNALFEAAVRRALAAMRFDAAEIGGRKVRQLVQMPFVFRLNR